jgi:hypothetical protein
LRKAEEGDWTAAVFGFLICFSNDIIIFPAYPSFYALCLGILIGVLLADNGIPGTINILREVAAGDLATLGLPGTSRAAATGLSLRAEAL